MKYWTWSWRGRLAGKFYSGFWIVLTTVSLVYLASLGFSGDLITGKQQKAVHQKSLADLTRDSEEIFLRVGRNKILTDQSRNDIVALQQSVSEFSQRLAGVEEETANISNQFIEFRTQSRNLTNSIPTRSASVDNTSSLRNVETTGSLQTADGSHAENRRSERIEYKPGVSFSLKPLPATGFSDQSNNLPQLRVAEKSGKSTATQTLFGIHLTSGHSIGEIQRSWEILKGRYPSELLELRARFIKETTSDGKPYQLIAGPFYNMLSAVEICARINRSLGHCEQTLFVGQPLPLIEKKS